MDTIINYFTDMPTLHRSIFLFGGLAFFLMIESAIPFFRFKNNRLKHTGTNIFFTLTTVLVNLPMAFLLLATANWVTINNFGIINMVALPSWLYAIVGLMLLDLIGAYAIHWIEHKVKVLWKFHLVHHTDQHVDTTSANRHHPGESVFRYVFTLLAVLIVGAPMWMVFMYQTCSVILTQFNHSNMNFPIWLDNILVWIICTPNMHRVHHHYRQPYSDSNYGNIFSTWDRLFGTYMKVDNAKLKYGVDTHMDPAEVTSIPNILKMPFQPYRPPIEYDREEVL